MKSIHIEPNKAKANEPQGREVTERFKVYKYSEAPEAVKEKIKDNFATDGDYGNWIMDERIETLKKLAERLGGDLDYSLSIVPDRGEFISIKPKYDEEDFRKNLQDFANDEASCPLTGVCYDDDIKYDLKEHGADEQGLQHALDSYIKSIHSEYESMLTDEYLEDHCDANGYEFTENGKLYSGSGEVSASSEQRDYDWTTMKMNHEGKLYSMRIDTEGGMIDVWHDNQGKWIWDEEATEAFKNHLGSGKTGQKPRL